MNKLIASSLIALGLLSSQASATDIKLGVLTCNVEGGWSLFVGSSRYASCVYTASDGLTTPYDADVTRLGIDVGYVGAKTLTWSVVSAVDNSDGTDLSGVYGGVNAEAAIGIGVGANALVGGFDRAYALQPISGQMQTGLSAALTVQKLELVKH